MQEKEIQYLLTGGYASEISVYGFDIQGALRLISSSPAIDKPSYLYVSAKSSFVYAVSEQDEGGTVHAYIFDRETGKLSQLNQHEIDGNGACYATISSAGKHLFVACYHSGSLSVFPIHEDGTLAPIQQRLQDIGRSADVKRQDGPHVHAVISSPDGRYVFYTDLGTDQISCCHYDAARELPLLLTSVTRLKPGSGPRHLLFSKDGRYLYVITELSGDLLVFQHDEGQLQLLQTISMLPANFTGQAGGGDIQFSADERYLYASNRGDANELIVFAVNRDDGQLCLLQRCDCKGKSPRMLAIDPMGRYLLAANQESDNIVVFNLDPVNGSIGELVFDQPAKQPSCLKFI